MSQIKTYEVGSKKIVDGIVKCSTSALKGVGKSWGFIASGACSVANFAKRFTTPRYQLKKGLFSGGMRKKQGLNIADVKARMAMLENEIREGYLKVGKIGSGVEDKEGMFELPEVKEIVGKVAKYEDELNSLKKYLVKIEEAHRENTPHEAIPFDLQGNQDSGVRKSLKHAIESSLKKANFVLKSDAIVFRKSLYDLLDEEVEIKRLAASELGKQGNKNAGPALKEALKYDDSVLKAEIINSLVRLEDKDIFDICKSYFKYEYAPVRAACIRGLYKAGRHDAAPLLIEALRDENAEVRNAAAMFLGLSESSSAVLALLQVASDPDKRVRKSAILALSNIRDKISVLPLIRLLDEDDEDLRKTIMTTIERISGASVPFKNGDKAERTKNIEQLKEWWIAKMYEGTATARTTTIEPVAATPAAETVPVAEESAEEAQPTEQVGQQQHHQHSHKKRKNWEKK